MPPEKELHYFDRSPAYPSPSQLSQERRTQRLLSRGEDGQKFRRRCWNSIMGCLRAGNLGLLRWYARYCFGTYDDAWYLSLFAPGRGRVCGEITPGYAILEAGDVARIARLLPAVKIIFLLRDPVERAWSQIRFEWTRGRFTDIEDQAQIRAFIEHPFQARRSDYLQTLEVWGAHFPPGQIFLGFYDDIAARPEEFLRDVHRFLGVALENAGPLPEVAERVNVSRESEMPATVRAYLSAKYLPDLEKLAVRLGGHAVQWRDAALATLGRGSVEGRMDAPLD